MAYEHFAFAWLSVKGIKGSFKERQRDWPGACVVPLLPPEDQGRLKQPKSALLRVPFFQRTVLGHLKYPPGELGTARWIIGGYFTMEKGTCVDRDQGVCARN